MTRIAEFYNLDIAMILFFALFILGRVIQRNAIKLLDNEARLKLVDASSRSSWWYIPLIGALLLLYLKFWLGIAALLFYFGSAMSYGIYWATRNAMPPAYVKRIILSGGLSLLAIAALGIGFATL